jgi:type IX secretion system substrate protein/GEVED domain-containing protein
MCRKIKFVLSFVFILFVRIVSAQTFTVTIPPGNPPTDTISLIFASPPNYEEARKPLGTYFGYERTAFRIPHSLIGHYGQISSISVFCDSTNNPGDVPLNIYVREVADSVFSNLTMVANEEAGAVLTYSNTIPATAFVKNQWVTIPFSTFFTHASYNKAIEFIFETNAASEGNVDGNEVINGKFFAHYQPVATSYVTEYWNSDLTPPSAPITLSFYCPNVQITIDSITNCGIPNKDTVLSTTDTLCLYENVVLSLSNNTIATGLSYQWQDSLVGSSSFVNIVGADSTTLLTNITDSLTKSGATTWYRCVVSCGSNAVYSTTKQITLRNYLNCYCYMDSLGGGCDFNTAIDSVAIPGTTLSNGLSGCLATYTLYPYSGNTTATLSQGTSYSLYTRYNGNVCSSFWIDYNQNGVLETSEWTQICLQSPSPLDTMNIDGVITPEVDSLFITPFRVPGSDSAKVGKTLMRIRTVAGGNTNDSLTVCSYFTSGEIEDYYITIDSSYAGINQVKGVTNQVTIYPNPTNESLTLFLSKEDGMANVNVYDITGRLVIQPTTLNAQHPTIDVSSLNDGVYFIEITTHKGSCTQKFIVAK